jgi:hypothetical protein
VVALEQDDEGGGVEYAGAAERHAA